MKKVLVMIILTCIGMAVDAKKVYLLSDNNKNIEGIVTNSDNYNYDNYLLDKNQILVVPKEDGILSNDIVNEKKYKIIINTNSKNSHIVDLFINDDGSFSYIPSNDVVGEVSFKYYIEYDNKKSNISNIYFYVKNTMTEYTIKYLDKETLREIAPTITKKGNVNLNIIEKPIDVENYYPVNNKIERKLNNRKSKNVINFYYSRKNIPNTGLWKNE